MTRNALIALSLASALMIAACGKKEETPAPVTPPPVENPAPAEPAPAPEAAPAEAAPAEAAPAPTEEMKDSTIPPK